MDQAVLVSYNVEAAAEMVRLVEAAGIELSVAMLFFSPEHGYWRLLVSAKELDRLSLPAAMDRLIGVWHKADFPPGKGPPFSIEPSTSPFAKALRRTFGKAKSVEGMRLGGQTFGGRVIEDAIVFRVR